MEVGHDELLQELCQELRTQVASGAPRRAEDVLAEHPELGNDLSARIELAYTEYVAREERGDKVECEEWYRRFPELRERMTRLFELHKLAQDSEDLGRLSLFVAGRARNSQRREWAARQFGDYEVLEEIGRGGMGVVFKARQLKLNRFVALKIILAGAEADPREMERFRAEAEMVARLQDPHIVTLYEFGQHDGWPYFALELVEGKSLLETLDGTPWPVDRATKLIETLARAAHEAHGKQIVHRDLKPANILLTVDGIPKITDFGLAKRLDASQGLTHTGAILGTPSYMSPEQARGSYRDIGPATDVYALGAIFYELLTGRPPFVGESVLDTLEQVRSAAVPPPRSLRSGLSRDAEIICLKCLDKEMAGRYASGLELADDLSRLRAGAPIQGRPIGLLGLFARWVRQPERIRDAGSVAIVVHLIVLLWVIWTGLFAPESVVRFRNQAMLTQIVILSCGHLLGVWIGYKTIQLKKVAIWANAVFATVNWLPLGAGLLGFNFVLDDYYGQNPVVLFFTFTSLFLMFSANLLTSLFAVRAQLNRPD